MSKLLAHYFATSPNAYGRSVVNPKTINRVANKRALTLFHQAATRVPAYKDFLKINHIKENLIHSISDFKKVPVVTKENYILKYPLPSRCFESNISTTHAFSCSSGSTGEPVFWPRELEQEIEGAMMHELLFEQVFTFSKQKTLFINAFGLGNWIAGMFTHNAAYLCRLHGVPFTLASPGYNQGEVFKVIKEYAHHFDQTIIACHPPISKIMIEHGQDYGIDWSTLNLKLFGAGEGFSENWRDYVLSLTHQTDPLRSIINIYGSADAGLMAFETPLSIAIHREANLNHDLNHNLFHSERKPYLYQFDPRLRYLEAVDDHITITMPSSMPLVRYDIHDHGSVLSYNAGMKHMPSPFLSYLESNHVDCEQWQLPFVYIFGRDQFMTTLYGVNIYPENIKAVLDLSTLQPYCTGRFTTKKRVDSHHDQYLELNVELKPHVKASKKLADTVTRLYINTLKQINSEYNYVEEKYSIKMHPHINFFPYNDPAYFKEGITKKMG